MVTSAAKRAALSRKRKSAAKKAVVTRKRRALRPCHLELGHARRLTSR